MRRTTTAGSARCLALAAVLAAGLVCGCDSGPVESAQEQVQQLLVGTWLREYQDEGAVVRRVLVLQSDGSFREMSRVAQGAAPVAEHVHEGEWLFDGTNLKRRYLRVDGQLPAAPMVPFAAFELRFPSRNEFVGVDNVHRREVRYRRVAQGTEP